MAVFRKITALCAALLLLSNLFGQQTLQLRINPAEQSVFWENIKGFKPGIVQKNDETAIFTLKSRQLADTVCHGILEHFRARSFGSVSIDSLVALSDTVVAGQIWIGSPVRWISLRPADAQSAAWAAKARFREETFRNARLRHDALIRLEKNILEQAENSGYPFASVSLDSFAATDQGGITAVLHVETRRFFTIKAIKNNGDVKLPSYFLSNYLGIRPGAPYSRARVMQMRDQLRSLLFVESTANPTVSFAGSEATVNVYLKKKRASRFDFIIGILPQSEGENSKVLLTGSLSAAFQNALSLGEKLSIEIERLRPETQRLDVQASVPYLLGAPLGVDGRLGIFKRDSTWVDAQGDLGVQYLLPGGNYFRALWENKSASLQYIDTAAVIAARKLPPNLDFKQNGIGLEAVFSHLDYRYNPRKGWLFNLKGLAGINQIQRNNQIESLSAPGDPTFRFSTLYDSIAGRASRLRLEGGGAVYLPVFSRSAVKIGMRAGGIFSNKPVFANEQYRLGGNKLLRGFDEESLLATRFVVATAEWRLLIGPNSFLGAFADWSYVENITNSARVFLRPLGLGAGLNFETKAGVFGINVAVGRRDVGQSVDFRAAKFHLGYVSLF